LWNVGIIFYALLCGFLPFDDPDTHVLYDKIRELDYEMPDHISPEARDLMVRLLTADPATRLTVDGVRRHPWYTQTAYATDPERIDMASMIVPTSSIDLDPLVMKVLHLINIASMIP
jgi:serine/threonine protein kinase